MRGSQQPYLPTPAAIRRACREIQAAWNTHEREKRASWQQARQWNVPVITNFDMPSGEDTPWEGER